MPTVLLAPLISTPPAGPLRKSWTRHELEAIESAGLLHDQDLELIEGELILKMGKKRPHTIAVSLLLKYLASIFSPDHVQQEAPIDVHPEDNPTSEPEPDLIVLKLPQTHYRMGNPRSSDLHLVCEVSDSTLAFDLSTKAQLYARAGIMEYWVLDIPSQRLVVHREADASGYQSIQAYQALECVTPLAAPQAELHVASLFLG